MRRTRLRQLWPAALALESVERLDTGGAAGAGRLVCAARSRHRLHRLAMHQVDHVARQALAPLVWRQHGEALQAAVARQLRRDSGDHYCDDKTNQYALLEVVLVAVPGSHS